MDEIKYYPARMDYPNLCKPYSNADRIRSMSDEELAVCLYEIGYYGGWLTPKCAIDWLQQPPKENDKNGV